MRAALCGFALGVLWLQRQAVLPEWRTWCVLTLCGGLAAIWAAWGRRRGRLWAGSAWCALWLAAACAGFGFAGWRAHERLAESLPSAWEGRDIVVRGSIRGLPARDTNSVRFLFNVESAAAPIGHFPRTLQLTWMVRNGAMPTLDPGARWRLTVRLKRPHGNANFGVRDTEAALLARNVRATGYVSVPAAGILLPGRASGIGVVVDRWRAALRARIEAVLDDGLHRGIVTALAIGAQDDISAADWQLMRNTGTSHLVAISGLHIGLVASLAGWLAGALWRRSCFIWRDWPLLVPAQKVAIIAGALCATLHAALAGFNVPAQRALWMLAAIALAFISGRAVAPSLVLSWALGVVLLIDPWAVVSPGFWLSFCAVAAILFAISGQPRIRKHESRNCVGDDLQPGPASRLSEWLCRRCAALYGRLGSAAHAQFAVTVALAPLTLYWFAQLPLLGPVANAFAIPWVSLLITPVVLAGIALPRPLDAFAWRVAHDLLGLLCDGLQRVAEPSWALWRLPQPDGWTLAAAAVGVVWWLAPWGWPLRWAAPLTWLPLLMPAPSGPPAGAFRLTALDIGQGSSILVETAHHALLFDAGPGPESTHAGERIVVPYLQAAGITALDSLMISHSDTDHSGGAPAVLEAIQVHQLLAALEPADGLWAHARAAGASLVPCAAGQRWQWDGVDFAVLWPDAGPLRGKPNAHCCVLRVSTASSVGAAPYVAALLAADLEAPAERTLVAREPAALRAHILLVPHHGSKTSSTEPFLDSIDPLVAVFQVGYRNRFHHPDPSVFARYQARHIELVRSDEDGAVRIEAGNLGLSVERYRDTHRRYWMDR